MVKYGQNNTYELHGVGKPSSSSSLTKQGCTNQEYISGLYFGVGSVGFFPNQQEHATLSPQSDHMGFEAKSTVQ